MKNVFLVKEKEAETARKMEQKLLSLPEESGILFVGVEVVQDPFLSSRSPLFKIFIGCSRERDTKLMDAIVKRFLRGIDDVEEHQLVVMAARGIARS